MMCTNIMALHSTSKLLASFSVTLPTSNAPLMTASYVALCHWRPPIDCPRPLPTTPRPSPTVPDRSRPFPDRPRPLPSRICLPFVRTRSDPSLRRRCVCVWPCHPGPAAARRRRLRRSGDRSGATPSGRLNCIGAVELSAMLIGTLSRFKGTHAGHAPELDDPEVVLN